MTGRRSPREPAPPELWRFQLLHVAYAGLELVKVACLALAGAWLMRSHPGATQPAA